MSTQEETEEMRGHAEDSDGIEEYDNQLPTWWVGLFILTVIWGVWLILDWHVFDSKTLSGQFAARIADLGLDEGPDLSGFVIDVNEGSVTAGRDVYVEKCAVCHQADGSGNIGPSLIDAEWRYDHHVEGILVSIAIGRPNGMPGWLAPLGEEKVTAVTAYVASLTNAPSRVDEADDVAGSELGAPAPQAFPDATQGQGASVGEAGAVPSTDDATNDRAPGSPAQVDGVDAGAQAPEDGENSGD